MPLVHGSASAERPNGSVEGLQPGSAHVRCQPQIGRNRNDCSIRHQQLMRPRAVARSVTSSLNLNINMLCLCLCLCLHLHLHLHQMTPTAVNVKGREQPLSVSELRMNNAQGAAEATQP